MTAMWKGAWVLVLSFVCGAEVISGYVEAVAGNVDLPASPHWEPQVAMVCGEKAQYHNKYQTDTGRWVNDLDSKATCSRDKMQILKYCQKIYHNKEITNIVEGSSYLKLNDWCKVGHKKCRGSHWVKPYRCLEGKFQSDALLVPDGCQFNHVHNESLCVGYESWNHTARDYCRSHATGMQLRTFGMLLPCGIDLFRGVEFVCCPEQSDGTNLKPLQETSEKSGKVNSKEKNDESSDEYEDDDDDDSYIDDDDKDYDYSDEDNDDDDDDDEDDDDYDEYDDEDNYDDDDEDDSEEDEKAPSSSTAAPTPDPYFTHFNARNEHDDFRAAEERMEAHHREKITKVMKDWAELEDRYQQLKTQDPEGAEQFRQQMTSRFQATVHALEAEVGAEKKQLLAMHQKRVLAHIHRRKKDAMNCYTNSLNERPPTSRRVEKCLQKLVRALHKDRHHTLAHYRHLLNTSFKQAESEKNVVLAHLQEIDKMVNQSLNMLARFPSLSRKLVPLMKEYVQALRARDSTPAHLLSASNDNEEELLNTYTQEAKDKLEALKQKQAEEAVVRAHQQAVREEKKRLMQQRPFDSESMEDERSEASVHHAMADPLVHQQPMYSVHRKILPPNENKSVYVTMAFAGVALMTALVAGIVVLRRRNTSSPRSQGFVEVDQGVTPEERHVANMQINGYENPTYKYFEGHEA